MAKYVKRPVTVDAVKWEGDWIVDGIDEAPDWVHERLAAGVLYFKDQGDLYVRTLEGDMRVEVGDYLVRGVRGELYPVKPDIFEETYEEVGDLNGYTVSINGPGTCATIACDQYMAVAAVDDGAGNLKFKCASKADGMVAAVMMTELAVMAHNSLVRDDVVDYIE